MADTPLLASTLTDWYTRINRIRQKKGEANLPCINMSKISIPNVQNSLAIAKHMNDLKTQILALESNTSLRLANFTPVKNQNISSGTQILETQKNDFTSTIASLEKICAKCLTTACITCSQNSNYSDDSYQSTGCSDNSVRSVQSTDYSKDSECSYQSVMGQHTYKPSCPDSAYSQWSVQGTGHSNSGYSNNTVGGGGSYSINSDTCSNNSNYGSDYSNNSNTCSDQSGYQTCSVTGNNVSDYINV